MIRYTYPISKESQTAPEKHKKEYKERSYPLAEPDEIDLPDEIWLEELLPIVPEKQPERYAGQHVQEKSRAELSIEHLLEEGMQQMEEGKKKDSPSPDPMDMGTKVNAQGLHGKQIQYKNSINQNSSEDGAPKGKETSLLMLVLEIICGFSILLAAVSTIIAWHVFNIRTGGW